MTDILGLDKIYVLHHIPFKERGEYIKKRLLEEDVDFEMITQHSPEEIDYEKEIENWNTTNPIEIVHPYGSYISIPHKISITSLSLVLKHLKCYKNQVDNNYENVLILEDDVEIRNNFKNYLSDNMKDFLSLQKNDDVSMLTMGVSHMRISKSYKVGKWAHYGENQKTRCTHAYVLNIKATRKIIDNFYPINNPIDFILDAILQKNPDIKVAWSEPGLKQITI